ncbi:hypothetical protein Lal_00001708 [Lupinus albus]|nr:hypothetical protein Lal_00001708 [Lupinus albus]
MGRGKESQSMDINEPSLMDVAHDTINSTQGRYSKLPFFRSCNREVSASKAFSTSVGRAALKQKKRFGTLPVFLHFILYSARLKK